MLISPRLAHSGGLDRHTRFAAKRFDDAQVRSHIVRVQRDVLIAIGLTTQPGIDDLTTHVEEAMIPGVKGS